MGLTTVVWFSSSGQNTDPQNDDERYALLSSGTKPNRAANKPDDYRYVIAAGPFAQLNPGESLSFQTAYVIGDGDPGYRANMVNAQRVFNGAYVDADKNDQTGIGGRERCLQVLEPGVPVPWNDPCDTLEVVDTIKATLPCNVAGPHYKDADCNYCTGVLGAEALPLALEMLTEAAVVGKLTDEVLTVLRDDYSFEDQPPVEVQKEILGVLEHDGYLKHMPRGYVFVSKLLKDWWKNRHQYSYTPVSKRGV